MSTGHVYFSGKAFEKIQRAVQKRNREFAKLSLSRQCVEIARDVISQLKAGTIKAKSVYFSSPELEYRIDRGVRTDCDASVALAQVTDCQVCGIGSLFKCAVQNANGLKFKDFASTLGERESEVEYLKTWFSEETLNLVEDYYERKYEYYGFDKERGFKSHQPIDRKHHPILLERSSDDRLRMIMENIISNRGEFNPYKGKHSLP